MVSHNYIDQQVEVKRQDVQQCDNKRREKEKNKQQPQLQKNWDAV